MRRAVRLLVFSVVICSLALGLVSSSVFCAGDFKVVVLTARKLTTPADLSTWSGIVKVQKELGIDVKVIECTEIAEYEEQVQAVSEEGYDVVFFLYDTFLSAVKKVAPKFPRTKYIGLWVMVDEPDKYPNLKGMFFRPNQGSFLAGIVAAKMTKTKHVGFIGGGINPGILQFLAGYEAGLKYTDPSVKLTTAWAGTFEDPFKGRELAVSLYRKGADVIFQVANQTGLGVIMAAKEFDKYVIGVDVDQSHLAPGNVIASVLLDHGLATFDAIKEAYEGRFKPGQVYYGLNEGIPVIAIPDYVPKAIRDAVQEAEKQIIAGKIVPPTTTTTR